MALNSKKRPETVDDYILGQPVQVRKRLEELRSTIRKAAPGATEKIGYSMPAYTYKGMLLYFAAHTNHISIYPYPSAMEAFKKEIAGYRTSKGTMQFRHSDKLPMRLISDIVKFRVRENELKVESKRTSGKPSKNKNGE
ncbi:MAG TPA: DUF1801 domain-containing protein [Bacteroidales bacterium]|nr:DUF1801 domain-containing protein [Bacteroidales bacterium]